MNGMVVIIGPTASGKSDLAVRLSRKFGGEVISADSRQVYKGLTIGSGKITKKEMRGVPHHLLDVASPKRRFPVARFKALAERALAGIVKRGNLPIVAGGSPLYIYAFVDGWIMPQVAPDAKLRAQFENQSIEELFEKLRSLDPRRAGAIEQKNKRRLIRALEIVVKTGKPVPVLKKHPLPYNILFLGVSRTPGELKKRIFKRLAKRLKSGMVAEVKKLRAGGLSWRRLEEFGLEYRCVARYLQKKISKEQMTADMKKEITDFARRQMNWFSAHGRSDQGKKNPIRWVANFRQAELLVKEHLRISSQ